MKATRGLKRFTAEASLSLFDNKCHLLGQRGGNGTTGSGKD